MSKKILVRLLATVFLATVAVAHAQPAKKVPRIGYLSLASGPGWIEEEFLQGLRDLGYIDGQSIIIEYRWAAGKTDRLPALAEELVRLKVDLIAVRATPVVQAAKNATTSIPIVMLIAADPVRSGFVASLAQPGGNITGMSSIMPELAGKRFELLKEVLPKLSRVAFLAYGPDPAHKLFVKDAEDAARQFKMRFQPLIIGAPEGIEGAFSAMTKERAGALIVQPLFVTTLGQGRRIAQLAVKNRLPTISDGIPFADEGGLMLYGPDQKPMYRRAAVHVDKILKGTKPADIPVEQPMKFDFVINLKTAKEIGVTFPDIILFKANRVIQ